MLMLPAGYDLRPGYACVGLSCAHRPQLPCWVGHNENADTGYQSCFVDTQIGSSFGAPGPTKAAGNKCHALEIGGFLDR